MKQIKLTKEERAQYKQYLYNDLIILSLERPEFKPKKRDSLNTLLESFFCWADEYNDGYFPEMDDVQTDKYSAWLVQNYKEFCGY